MASHLSVSQSLQASTILQQQHTSQPQRHTPRQQRNEDVHLTTWQQMRLTAALVGVEGSTAFEQVYTFLSLQYLGVPVALMSVHGIIAGVTSATLIPVAGMLADGGNNPKRRKLYTLLFSMCVLLTGCLLIISACALKIVERRDEIVNKTSTIKTVDVVVISEVDNKNIISTSKEYPNININNNLNVLLLNSSVTNDLERQLLTDGDSNRVIPLTGMLGIVGFILLDVGFDFGNPLIRAYVLDHTPASQHTQMLVMTTLVASLAGLAISSLGVLDLPNLLEDTLHVDGTAASFIVTLTVIMTIVISFFGCSILTGRSISKSMQRTTQSSLPGRLENEKSPLIPAASCDNVSLLGISFERPSYLSLSISIQSMLERDAPPRSHHLYTPAHAQYEDLIRSQSLAVLEEIPEHPTSSKSVSHLQTYFRQNAHIEHSNTSYTPTFSDRETSCKQVITKNQGMCNNIGSERHNEHTNLAPKFSTLDPHFTQCDIHFVNSKDANNVGNSRETDLETKPGKTALLNRRIVVLIISTALSTSGLIGVILYSSNALTLGVFHGDPSASLGTADNDRYKQGLRTASLGNVVMYISFFTSCALNTRCFKLIGEKVFYVTCLSALSIALVILVTSQRVEAYFLMMALIGPYRTCVFTLPFVLANQYTQSQSDDQQADNSSRAGRVTAIIGSSLPCTYIVVSCVMGPVIDALGNVWVPLIWSVIAFCGSVSVFSSLFCLRRG